MLQQLTRLQVPLLDGPRRSRRRGPFFIRLGLVPKPPFSDNDAPEVRRARRPSLVTGDVEFFVEEAAARTREILSMGKEAEILRFEDDAPVESVSDALLNRSLFSPQRIVELDISRLLGTEAPGRLLTKAVEAWEAGKRREAFKQARLLLAALDLPLGAPEETAEAAARKVRRKDEAELLAEILKELPEEKSGGAAILRSALRVADRAGRERRHGGAHDGGLAAGGRGPGAGDRGPRPRPRNDGRRRRGAGAPAARGGPGEGAGGRSGARGGAASSGPDGLPGGAVRDGAREAPRVGGQGRPDPRHRHRGERRGRVLGGRLRASSTRSAGATRATRSPGSSASSTAGTSGRATATSRRSRTSGPSSSWECSRARFAGCS